MGHGAGIIQSANRCNVQRRWRTEDRAPGSKDRTAHRDIPGGRRGEIDLAAGDNHSLIIEIARYGQIPIDQQEPIARVAAAGDGEWLVGIDDLDSPESSPGRLNTQRRTAGRVAGSAKSYVAGIGGSDQGRVRLVLRNQRCRRLRKGRKGWLHCGIAGD